MHRPFEVPGGIPTALLITLPKLCLLFATLCVAPYLTIGIACGCQVLFCLLYCISNRAYNEKIDALLHDADEDEPLVEPHAAL